MINSKTLRRAVGISQEDDVPGNSSPNVPLINQRSVVVGRFKRGRTDKPFKVTSKNYKALLGEDQQNECFLIVQDAFISGATELWIMRIGSPEVKLSDGSQVTDEKNYEQIALESHLYPIPVFREGVYQPQITHLDVKIRSIAVSPKDIIEAYCSNIEHFDIKKMSDGKWFEFSHAYVSDYKILDLKLGQRIKQPDAKNEGYVSSIEALSLSLRYSNKAFTHEDEYKVSVDQLNIERISNIKEKTIDAGYMPEVDFLDARLSQELQQTNYTLGTDGYTQNHTLLNLILSSELVANTINTDGYQASAESMDLSLQQVLAVVDTTIDNPYAPTVKPLNISLIDTGQYEVVNDGYKPSVALLDIKYVNHLAGDMVHQAQDSYTPSIEAIGLTTKKYNQIDLNSNYDGYKPSVKTLNIFTTQRIK